MSMKPLFAVLTAAALVAAVPAMAEHHDAKAEHDAHAAKHEEKHDDQAHPVNAEVKADAKAEHDAHDTKHEKHGK